MLNSEIRAGDTAMKKADMVCAFMLPTFQWELGAASIPSRTGLSNKKYAGLMLEKSQTGGWASVVHCSQAGNNMATKDSSQPPSLVG